jgi:hypothetical protein
VQEGLVKASSVRKVNASSTEVTKELAKPLPPDEQALPVVIEEGVAIASTP